MSRSKIPSKILSMITNSNQAWLAKMTGRRLQEVMEESEQWAIFIVNELAEYFTVNP